MGNLSEHYAKAAERAAYDARMQRLGGEVNEKVAQFYDESSKMYAAQAASAALEENRRATEAQQREFEKQRRESEERQKELEREAYQKEYKAERQEEARKEAKIACRVIGECMKYDNEANKIVVVGKPKFHAARYAIEYLERAALYSITELEEERINLYKDALEDYIEENFPEYNGDKESQKDIEKALEYRDSHKSYDDEIFSLDCLKIMIGTALVIIASIMLF